MASRSRDAYDRRLHAVIAFIDAHLDQPLALAQLAQAAHFSPFHFHRIFTAWAGEPVAEYVRRRRLEIAAIRLQAQPDLSVTEVALGTGFTSAEVFSRAFRRRFGATPTAWRRSKGKRILSKDHQVENGDTRQSVGRQSTRSRLMNVSLVDRVPTDIAYLRHVGPYGEPVSKFWQQEVYPWMATNGLIGLPRYGMSLDDPTITQPSQCRYDAGVEVPAAKLLSGKRLRQSIPGGRYAALAFKGTVDQIGAAWDALLRDWLPQSGLQLDSRPFFEFYSPQARYDASTGQFEADLCVPVAPL